MVKDYTSRPCIYVPVLKIRVIICIVVTIAQADLTRPHRKTGSSDAGEEIDRLISTALKTNRPTYLTLPTDIVGSKGRDSLNVSRDTLGESVKNA